MNASERVLVVLLRVGGGVMLLALLAVFLPPAWMAWTHRWLGLGELPRAPVVDYLARSASALYCIHGGLLIVLSRDVRRFAPAIAYLAWAGIAFGVMVFGIDLAAGMPRYWSLGEGPMVLLFGAIILGLVRGVRPPETRSS